MATKIENITTSDVAAELHITPRELRVYLRALADEEGVRGTAQRRPGKGRRYALPGTKAELAKMRKGYAAWANVKAAAKAVKDEGKATARVIDMADEDAPDIDDSDSQADMNLEDAFDGLDDSIDD